MGWGGQTIIISLRLLRLLGKCGVKNLSQDVHFWLVSRFVITMALVSSALSVRVTTMLITTSDTRQFLCIFVHARYYNVNYLEWYAAIFHRFWHKLPGGMHSHSVWRIIIIDDKITNFFHPIGGKINAHWFQKRELDTPEPIAHYKYKAIRLSEKIKGTITVT